MTETSHPITAVTGPHVEPFPYYEVDLSAYRPPAAPQKHVTLEDDGLINCPCGYPDDDGSTVACDICDTWQHILCYYPEVVGTLPPDLQHYCIQCRPRHFDAHAAQARQQEARQHRYTLTNGLKRQPSKSTKKKVKEPTGPGQSNGWPLDKHRHDRNSASPRDQPPPAKRPKISHRTSNSASLASATSQPRKRNGSTNNHRRSLSLSPDSPIHTYTEEFLQCHWHDTFAFAKANLHKSIGVTNTLTEWLNNPHEVLRITNGIEQHSIFQRWDGDIEEIVGQTEIEIQEEHQGSIQYDNGRHPSWKKVALGAPLASQACIGELRGHVGFKEEYQDDPANRWSSLRHPEPFVFFHPHLPIYIDARNEGTRMRYVRRSCAPNAELKIIITNQTDYHFCFIATRDIAQNEEIAVAWDSGVGLAESLSRRSSNGQLSNKDFEHISRWVSTVLANCGPCACELDDCSMARFDRRGQVSAYEDEFQATTAKIPKATRKKKPGLGHHTISPLNTHAVNSRSGSEARKVDLLDDEPTDSRSASGSAGGGGSASRDITPNTHYSANGSHSTMPEGLSERERKKLAKEEEMFRRQEEEATGKSSKKKRSSGGSNMNTPSATSTKQFNFAPVVGAGGGGASKYANASTEKQSGLPSTKLMNGKRPRASTTNTMTAAATAKTLVKDATRMVKVKPDYRDAETQCDMDKEATVRRAATPESKRNYISVTQRLRERCALNNARRKANHANAGSSPEAGKRSSVVIDLDKSRERSPQLAHPQSMEDQLQRVEAESVYVPNVAKEIGMADAEPMEHHLLPSSSSPAQQHAESPHRKGIGSRHATASSHPPMDPPAPPWPETADMSSSPAAGEQDAQAPLHLPKSTTSAHLHNHKHPIDMHISMPPPPLNPFATASQPSQSSAPSSDSTPGPGTLITGSITGSLAQSPPAFTGSATPMFSPAVTASVLPSPARKKLSLSDYTRRSKAKDKDKEREGSPAAPPPPTTPLGTVVVPPLLSNGLSEAPGLAESGSFAAEGLGAGEEDVKVDDAGHDASS